MIKKYSYLTVLCLCQVHEVKASSEPGREDSSEEVSTTLANHVLNRLQIYLFILTLRLLTSSFFSSSLSLFHFLSRLFYSDSDFFYVYNHFLGFWPFCLYASL